MQWKWAGRMQGEGGIYLLKDHQDGTGSLGHISSLHGYIKQEDSVTIPRMISYLTESKISGISCFISSIFKKEVKRELLSPSSK